MPYILQHNLKNHDAHAALSLCHHYSSLSYFPHALEILLHHVLDDEVDNQSKNNGQQILLPSVMSFLQTAIPIQQYLDIVVQCTRKTELRSWRTLFANLPAPKDLFEQALKLNSLKTAGGYLLVLQAFDESEGGDDNTEESVVRLLRLASQEGDWELCGELARFLIALDGSGEMLRRAVVKVGLRKEEHLTTSVSNGSPHGLALTIPDSASLSPLTANQRKHQRRISATPESVTGGSLSDTSKQGNSGESEVSSQDGFASGSGSGS